MRLQTVVELPNYIAQAERLLTKEKQAKVIQTVANNPEWGVVIQGTGGIRKARLAKGHKGKSGGRG
jgi:hypothetical protein